MFTFITCWSKGRESYLSIAWIYSLQFASIHGHVCLASPKAGFFLILHTTQNI